MVSHACSRTTGGLLQHILKLNEEHKEARERRTIVNQEMNDAEKRSADSRTEQGSSQIMTCSNAAARICEVVYGRIIVSRSYV